MKQIIDLFFLLGLSTFLRKGKRENNRMDKLSPMCDNEHNNELRKDKHKKTANTGN